MKSSETVVEAMNTAIASRTAVRRRADARGAHDSLKVWMQVSTHSDEPYMLMTPASIAPRKNISITKTNTGCGMMPSRSASPPFWPSPATRKAPTDIAPMTPSTVPT